LCYARLVAWAKVNPRAFLQKRWLVLRYTGDNYGVDAAFEEKFIATVQHDWLVYHIFEYVLAPIDY
jgi:hypothetical protein